MTPFQRACVVAFWARLNHGDGSVEYAQALVEMEGTRLYRSNVGACGRCGRPGHRKTTCENLQPDGAR